MQSTRAALSCLSVCLLCVVVVLNAHSASSPVDSSLCWLRALLAPPTPTQRTRSSQLPSSTPSALATAPRATASWPCTGSATHLSSRSSTSNEVLQLRRMKKVVGKSCCSVRVRVCCFVVGCCDNTRCQHQQQPYTRMYKCMMQLAVAACSVCASSCGRCGQGTQCVCVPCYVGCDCCHTPQHQVRALLIDCPHLSRLSCVVCCVSVEPHIECFCMHSGERKQHGTVLAPDLHRCGFLFRLAALGQARGVLFSRAALLLFLLLPVCVSRCF